MKRRYYFFLKALLKIDLLKAELVGFKKSFQYDSENVDKANKKLEDINRTVEETKVEKLAVSLSQK